LQAAVLTAPTDLLGLITEAGCTAAIFDLDGVVTRTTYQHVSAWRQALDEFLTQAAPLVDRRPFDVEADYQRHLDGRTRTAGLKAFLASRGAELPLGREDDTPFASVLGLATYKNDLYLAALATTGIEVFADAVEFIERLRRRSVPVALVTSSKNAPMILAQTGLAKLFDVMVDGNVVEREGLCSKPAPDSFAYAAERLGTTLQHCAIFEDTIDVLDALLGLAPGCAIGVVRNGCCYPRKGFRIVDGFDV
jgi:HAD superfamily hydrolase (TIGR01509 family)